MPTTPPEIKRYLLADYSPANIYHDTPIWIYAAGYVLGSYVMACNPLLWFGDSFCVLLAAPLSIPVLIGLGFMLTGAAEIGTTVTMMLLFLIAWLLAIISMCGVVNARRLKQWNIWPWVVLGIHASVMFFLYLWLPG